MKSSPMCIGERDGAFQHLPNIRENKRARAPMMIMAIHKKLASSGFPRLGFSRIAYLLKNLKMKGALAPASGYEADPPLRRRLHTRRHPQFLSLSLF